jgi:hypothetical protein
MKKYIAILLMAFSSASVFAHTALASSTPTDNAMLMQSPKTVEVTFGSGVRLVSLVVLNNQNEEVAINFSPTMTPSKSFTYDLPTLMPNTYSVTWTIMGEDGHKMKGDFSFMVHAMDNRKNMTQQKMVHSKQNGH